MCYHTGEAYSPILLHIMHPDPQGEGYWHGERYAPPKPKKFAISKNSCRIIPMTDKIKKLADQANKLGITHFGLSTGPAWKHLTPDERADQIGLIFDALEKGGHMPLRNLDGPPWFSMPQCSVQDFMSKNLKYRKWQILNKLHKYACKFDRWWQRVEWKVRKILKNPKD